MMTPPSTSTTREILRLREQKSRQRRAAKIAHMRSTIKTLEVAALVLRTVDDDDAVWDGFLEDNAIQLRFFLRQNVRLSNEVKKLVHEQTQLRRLVKEHELATQVIAGIVQEQPVDDWEWALVRWRALARQYYRPWTRDECQEEMETALREVNAFQWSTDKQTTGMNFLGWRDSRRVDYVRGRFQCQFYKTFRGYDMMDYVNVAWDAYTDAQTYYDVILGPAVRARQEVMQQLGPNIIIVRSDEQYPGIDVDVHVFYLVFRVKTETGFTQCIRTIFAPELMKEIQEPRDIWPNNFIWLQFEELANEERGYKVRFGGRLGEVDINYTSMWMMGALGAVLRSEIRATDRGLITSD